MQVRCIFEGHVDLTLGKIYKVLPDKKYKKHQFIRIIDDSGEDYLYSMKWFETIS